MAEDKKSYLATTKVELPDISRYRQVRFFPELENSFAQWNYKTETIGSDSQDKFYETKVEDSYRMDIISYKVYGNPYFWWVLCLVNGIRNPFMGPEPGQVLRVPSMTKIIEANS